MSDGARISDLISVARAARRRGLDLRQIEGAVVAHDFHVYGARAPDDFSVDLNDIYDVVVSMAAREPLLPPGQRLRDVFELGSEVEIAQRVMRESEPLAPQWVGVPGAGVWYYEPERGVWRELDPGDIYQRVALYDGVMHVAGIDPKTGDPKLRPMKISHKIMENAYKIVEKLRADDEFFDGERKGIAFADTFVEIRDNGAIITDPHGPEHRARVAMPYRWHSGAEPPRFLQTLREIWADRDDVEGHVRVLREWMGAMMAGLAPRYARGIILSSRAGSTGKSTIQDIVCGIMPEDAVASIAPHTMGHEYSRAALYGARLNSVAELPFSEIGDSEAVKAIITGDYVRGRRIYSEGIRFRPTAGHLFSCNRPPGTRDHSGGFWRRWIVLECTRVFGAGGDAPEVKGLAQQIVAAEAGEIASWALEGACDLIRRGYYEIPVDAERALEEWRHAADPVKAYLDERCRPIAPDARITLWTQASVLYSDFRAWCERNGHRTMTSTSFADRVQGLGIERTRTRSGSEYAVEILPALRAV